MSKPRVLSGKICLGGGILLLLLAGTRHESIIEQRKQDALQSVSPEDTTPLVALTTVAFGGFRGLVADALWIRASELQENGQYFELVQLAQWITQLEPRSPEVWSFQGWNLAYNISTLFPDQQDRWRWVQHGIDLLQKDGLKHNPGSASLYFDIGWMYQHKIGMEFDLAHWYYKDRLAEQVDGILPGGDLPKEELTFSQRQELANTLNLQVASMRELDEKYGPIDWRIPEAHSLYWATKGLEVQASPSRQKILRRMQRQSLASMILAGKRVEDPETGASLLLPRLDLAPLVLEEYRQAAKAFPENEEIQHAYRTFLKDTSLLFAEYARVPEALTLYEELAEVEETVPPGREAFQVFLDYGLGQHPSELRPKQAMARVAALLMLSEDPDISEIRARGLTRMARQVHELYQDSRTTDELLKRTGLPPFEAMQRIIASQNR